MSGVEKPLAEMDGRELLDLARATAYRYTPPRLRHWAEDLAAELALRLLKQQRAGVAWVRLRWHLSQAIGGLVGHGQSTRRVLAEGWTTLVPRDLVDEARVDDRALCFRRLQQAWPRLTELQREALLRYLTTSGYRDAPAWTTPHALAGSVKYAIQELRGERAGHVRGEQTHNAVLCEEDVRRIRAAYDAGGVSQSEIARRHKLTPQVVHAIVRRKAWRHVA